MQDRSQEPLLAQSKVILILNLGNHCLWNPESWALESGIQLKESRIPLTISYDWNPESTKSTDKAQNPVPGIRIHSVESRIQEYLGLPYIG